jgi:hypothetical protein
LMVFASAIVHLHCHRGFVCLDIIPCEQFLTHRRANRTQQFSDPIDPASQSRSGYFDPKLPLQDRALAIKWQVVCVFAYNRIDNDPITGQGLVR